MDRIFFGHHRCGTTWMRDIIMKVCEKTKMNYYVIGGTDSNFPNNPDNVNSFTCYVNSKLIDTQQVKSPFKGFHLIRDPRDCLISDYYSRKFSHSTNNKKMEALRSKLLDLPMENGLLEMLKFQQTYGYIAQIQDWKIEANSTILDITFEELVRNEYKGIKKIFSFLEIDLENGVMEKIIKECSFAEITGREPGEEDQKRHRRKGISGDWKNYFSEDTPLKKAIYEVLEPILLNLGYNL
jgi:hypothetical protein